MDRRSSHDDSGLPREDGQATIWEPPAPPATDLPFAVALLALGSARGLGSKGLRALVGEHREQLGRVWDLPAGQLSAELARTKVPSAAKIADEINTHRAQLLQAARAQADELARRGVRIISLSTLPDRLAELPGGPLWLFVQGDPSALYEGPHAALVGTRDATREGVRATEAAVRTMAAYPITLVSGLANGIDAAAHQAALRDGVRNVAFLGHGIDIVFPAETADIRAQIIHTGGAVASEYLPGEHYRKAQFVQRNRLQAGLADFVVAAEGRRTGGTAHTVRFATAYHRPVVGFTWPGAGDLIDLIDAEPTGQLIDIFTRAGRRTFDTLCRSTADAYGHTTYGLSLVELQLNREAELRCLPPEDLQRLQQRLDALLSQKDGGHGR
ncbi:DNA-processing protein DprA [Streptomyces sp. NPDC001027]|uniref:DNA-processing protein DprA n=1 Tax=Streptomyces sp. NPDC001027 TaxID=3154771 RepID=UPI003321F94A